MGRMKCNKIEVTTFDVVQNALRCLFVDFPLPYVSPPDDHVSPFNLPAYRAIPEFEPFQTAAEFVIANSPQSAERSLTRRSFLSFAYNRGQLDNLVKRYETMLEKDKKTTLAFTFYLRSIAQTKRIPSVPLNS